jgi:hypothetical protein
MKIFMFFELDVHDKGKNRRRYPHFEKATGQSHFNVCYEGGGIKYPDTLSRSEKLTNNYHNLKT